MESKKINQLATELAPDLSDLTIIGDPTTGISKKITLSQMASLFTGTVEEYANLAAFPLVGVADTIYIALDTNIIYRYDTSLSAYVILSPNVINSLVFSDANGFDGTITLVGSVATLSITTALTLGSVPFIGASGALIQDNSNLFFDDTNNRLGIATALPTTALDVFGSGIIGRLNATSTNNAFLGFASAGTNRWSIGNVQADQRFRIFSETNTSELFTILQTGEIGIGIANPLTKLHIDGGASALIANLDANVSVAKSVSFRSDNSNRINLEVSGTESGSNAGANFFIRRYSDAGALIDTPLTITRSTGAISLATALSGTSATFSGNLTVDTNTLFVDATNNNVGIGTTFISQPSAGATTLRILGSATNKGGAIFLDSSDSSVSTYIYTDSTSGLSINTSTSHPITFRTNDTTRLTIASSTGAATFSSSVTAGGNIVVQGGNVLSVFRSDNARAIQLYTTNNECIIDSWIPTSEPLHIRSNGTSGRIEFYTNATERMRITSGGQLLIGTITSNSYPLEIEAGAGGPLLYLKRSAANAQIFMGGTSAAGTQLFVQANGSGGVYLASGGVAWIAASDERLKTDLVAIEDAANKVTSLRSVIGRYKTDKEGTKRPFLIAQDVLKVLPEAVNKNEETGDLGVSYTEIIPLLVAAIKEQQAQIQELKALIAAK